jgi:hypothetical protein
MSTEQFQHITVLLGVKSKTPRTVAALRITLEELQRARESMKAVSELQRKLGGNCHADFDRVPGLIVTADDQYEGEYAEAIESESRQGGLQVVDSERFWSDAERPDWVWHGDAATLRVGPRSLTAGAAVDGGEEADSWSVALHDSDLQHLLLFLAPEDQVPEAFQALLAAKPAEALTALEDGLRVAGSAQVRQITPLLSAQDLLPLLQHPDQQVRVRAIIASRNVRGGAALQQDGGEPAQVRAGLL